MVSCRRAAETSDPPPARGAALHHIRGGIALTTAVYSVVDDLFLADLGIVEPNRVARLAAALGDRLSTTADVDNLRGTQTSFSSITGSAVIFRPVTTAGNGEVVAAEAVDGLYFTTFGVRPRLGRGINTNDDAMAARVLVLSDELWRGRFAADAAILGRIVRVAGQPFEVIGVMPPSFRGPYWGPRASRLWISLGAERALSTQDASPVTADPQSGLTVFGRLAPGVSLVTASAELGTIARLAPPLTRGAAAERARPSAWVAKP